MLENVAELSAVERIFSILKSHCVHIIIILSNVFLYGTKLTEDVIVRKIDLHFLRGCSKYEINPLTVTHSTQCMVHTLMTNLDSFAPTSDDQCVFHKLAHYTLGSPPVIEITSQVMINHYRRNRHQAAGNLEKLLLKLEEQLVDQSRGRESIFVQSTMLHENSWKPNTTWNHLISACNLSPEEHLLLSCLSILGQYPLPFAIVTAISSVITSASQKPHLTNTLHKQLMKHKILKLYPLSVVLHSKVLEHPESDPEFVYVPPDLADVFCSNMKEVDHVAALSTLFSSLTQATVSAQWLIPILYSYSHSRILEMGISKKVNIALVSKNSCYSV